MHVMHTNIWLRTTTWSNMTCFEENKEWATWNVHARGFLESLYWILFMFPLVLELSLEFRRNFTGS